MKQKTNLTEEDLLDRIKEIDPPKAFRMAKVFANSGSMSPMRSSHVKQTSLLPLLEFKPKKSPAYFDAIHFDDRLVVWWTRLLPPNHCPSKTHYIGNGLRYFTEKRVFCVQDSGKDCQDFRYIKKSEFF
jgi:hypothetical protein